MNCGPCHTYIIVIVIVIISIHKCSQEFALGALLRGRMPREGRGSWGEAASPSPQARILGSIVSGVRGGQQMHLGRTKSPENASLGHKCHLLAASRFNSVFGALPAFLLLGKSLLSQCLHRHRYALDIIIIIIIIIATASSVLVPVAV